MIILAIAEGCLDPVSGILLKLVVDLLPANEHDIYTPFFSKQHNTVEYSISNKRLINISVMLWRSYKHAI